MSSLIVFLKAQMSAFIGGITDYGIMIICTELFGIHYTVSIVISGVLGAVVNFSINKYWTFEAKAPVGKQISKFIIVVFGSVFFKSGGTYLVTEFGAIDYRVSRLLIELFVSLGFNYPMQKYWVFKK